MRALSPLEDFPLLDTTAYLDAAAVALMAVPVKRAMFGFDDGVCSRGTLALDDDAHDQVYDAVRRDVARFITANENDIAILTSATECMSQLAWSMAPRTGRNVVSIDADYPTVTYPWLRVAQAYGLDLRLLRAAENSASICFEEIERLVDENTVAISISHVQYATGHQLPLRALADLVHANGGILIVDATQSVGVVPIDVAANRADVLISSAYKWICGPLGAAFCYMTEAVWDDFNPPFVGPRSTVEQSVFNAKSIKLANGARRMEYASGAYAAGRGLGHALNYLMCLGVDRIRQHSLALTGQLIEGLEELGASVITPKEDQQRGGIVTARFPGHDPNWIAATLKNRGVVTSPRFGGIRFAPHFYNSSDDIARCLSELSKILERKTAAV